MATGQIRVSFQNVGGAGTLFPPVFDSAEALWAIEPALVSATHCVRRDLRQIAAMNFASMEEVKVSVGISDPTFSGHFHSMAGTTGRDRTWPFRPNVSGREMYAVNNQQTTCQSTGTIR